MDSLTPERRSWNMSRISGKNTKPELHVRSWLHRRGFRFRVCDKHLPGHPDIVLPKYKTVVEIRGCFWHHHRECRFAATPSTRPEFWLKKFEGTTLRDSENERRLQELGWYVIIIWECEITEARLNRLEEELRTRFTEKQELHESLSRTDEKSSINT